MNERNKIAERLLAALLSNSSILLSEQKRYELVNESLLYADQFITMTQGICQNYYVNLFEKDMTFIKRVNFAAGQKMPKYLCLEGRVFKQYNHDHDMYVLTDEVSYEELMKDIIHPIP